MSAIRGSEEKGKHGNRGALTRRKRELRSSGIGKKIAKSSTCYLEKKQTRLHGLPIGYRDLKKGMKKTLKRGRVCEKD